MSSSSSSLSFSDSEESDVPEHLGLAPFAWDPTEKLKEANKKLQALELPTESEFSRPGSTIRFNETVEVKSETSSQDSSRTATPDKISETSEKSEKSETLKSQSDQLSLGSVDSDLDKSSKFLKSSKKSVKISEEIKEDQSIKVSRSQPAKTSSDSLHSSSIKWYHNILSNYPFKPTLALYFIFVYFACMCQTLRIAKAIVTFKCIRKAHNTVKDYINRKDRTWCTKIIKKADF